MNIQTKILTPPEQGLMSLPDLLKKKRAEKGMTQKELAEQAGVTLSALKQYETGRSAPTIEKLKALAAVLEIAPNDIWSELDVGVASIPELRMNVLTNITSFITEKATRNQLENIRDFVDGLVGDPTDQNTGETAIQLLADVVDKKGLEARPVKQALAAAKIELDGLDWDELVELAADYNTDFDGDGTEFEAEDIATARILVSVLYQKDLMQQPLKDLEKIREWINGPVNDFGFESGKIEGKSFFDNEEAYVKRLQNKLPVYILANAEKRIFMPEEV